MVTKGNMNAEVARISREYGTKRGVTVGFDASATYPDGTSVAMVASIQEFGSPMAGIPPRPFFRTAIANNKGDWANLLRNALRRKHDTRAALDELGRTIVEQIQESISEGAWEPLKRPEGFRTPLVKTGTMLNSITYEVTEE
jgi:hypothetical protein